MRRVLVVEDFPDAAEVMCELIRLLGHDAEFVVTGEEAMAAADTFDPDIVLVDLTLPGIDGYEVARRLRARSPRRDLVLVALTGWARPEDVARALAAGFDQHQIKPPSLDTFRRLLDRTPAEASPPRRSPDALAAAS
jgi:CheY-like chemotaxis protein